MIISSTKTQDGIGIIRPQGKLVGDNIKELSQSFDNLLESDTMQVVLNFKDVNIMDSSAVGLLVKKYHEFTKKGASFRFCNLRTSLKELFKVAGLETLFEIYESEAGAVASFNGAAKVD